MCPLHPRYAPSSGYTALKWHCSAQPQPFSSGILLYSKMTIPGNLSTLVSRSLQRICGLRDATSRPQLLICPFHIDRGILHTNNCILWNVSPEHRSNFLTNLLFNFQLMRCVYEPSKLKGKEGAEGLGSHENKNKAAFDWLLLKYAILLIMNEHSGTTSEAACGISISTCVNKSCWTINN